MLVFSIRAALPAAGRAFALGGAVALLSACGGGLTGAESITGSSGAASAAERASGNPGRSSSSSARPSSAVEPTDTALFSRADRTSYARLSARVGGLSGVSVSKLGIAERPETLGAWKRGVAWSTIKVPLALAVIRMGEPDSATRESLRQAITTSDNAAAERLWAALGSGERAAGRVEAELRTAGDSRTQVQARRVRAGFTPFGQTRWTPANQTRFMAGLTCVPDSDQVLALMGQIVADQRWGLGSTSAKARFKGGWGPGVSGGYLVRQTGILTSQGRRFAVSIANQPGDGDFNTGTRNLTRLAKWVVSHINLRSAPRRPNCKAPAEPTGATTAVSAAR